MNALSQSDLDAYATAFNAGPMMTYFGMRLGFRRVDAGLVYDDPLAGRAIVELPVVGPAHRGGLGTRAINGGVLSAMFDFGLGSTSMFAMPLRRSATVQLSISFLRATEGESARCEAWIDRVASSLVFTTGIIYDARGMECARATGVVALGKEQPIDERSRIFGDRDGALTKGAK